MPSSGLPLHRNASFRRLFVADAISVVGDWFFMIALLGVAHSVTGSELVVSLVLVAGALPGLVASPLAGALADRWDRRRTMLAADLVRAAVVPLALLAPRGELWVAFVVLGLLSVAGTLFGAARGAILPTVVATGQLAAANATSSAASGAAAILGASLGGVISATVGADAAILVNAVSFLGSALAVQGLCARAVEAPPARANLLADAGAGLRFVRGAPVVLALVVAGMSWGVAGGVFNVLLPVFALDVFAAGEDGLGLLYAVQGAGVMLGAWLAAALVGDRIARARRVFGYAYLLQGVGLAAFASSGSLAVGALALAAMRTVGGTIIPLDSTLLQHFTPDRMRGRVFALHRATYGGVMQLAMLAAGIALEVEVSPASLGLVAAGLCLVVGGAWFLISNGSAGDTRPAAPTTRSTEPP